MLTGDVGYLEKTCQKIYAQKNHPTVKQIKSENLRRYKHLFMAFGVLIVMELMVAWICPNENLIKSGNAVQGISRPEKGVYGITLVASMAGETGAFDKEVPFSISSLDFKKKKMESKGEDEKETFQVRQEAKLLDIMRNADQTEGEIILLPVETEEGDSIKWTEKGDRNFIYLMSLFLLSILLVYLGRYKKIKRLEKEARESVVCELPDFINLMLLLLSAGLIFTSAFEKYTDNLLKNNKKTYFSGQMIQVRSRVEETNSPLILELKNLAERMEIREFIRTVNMISDNVHKGSLLVEKLEVESERLWENRRKSAEEQNRLAETKLSFPLAIHLIVLIGITIAPALIST